MPLNCLLESFGNYLFTLDDQAMASGWVGDMTAQYFSPITALKGPSSSSLFETRTPQFHTPYQGSANPEKGDQTSGKKGQLYKKTTR